MSSELARGYANRAHESNIFPPGKEQTEPTRTGKRVADGAHKISQVFNGQGPNCPMESRNGPAPAPFLTDSNSVNTHGRRGGFVHPSDSKSDQTIDTAPADEYYRENESNINQRGITQAQLMEAYNENGDVASALRERAELEAEEITQAARAFKNRNQASDIFAPQEAAPTTKATYKSRTISNVF